MKILFLSFSVLLSACSTKVVYKDVYIPVKCDITTPIKPKPTNDLITNIANAFTYSKLLEDALNFCANKNN
ncbi:hypothetical protein BKH40_07655 [Helicobacter sp. 11S02629-2]|nr:hypothetical protein BKH40_07655 [Helicobacter sp. 11S02629-2]